MENKMLSWTQLYPLLSFLCTSVITQKPAEKLFSFESPKLSEEEMYSNFIPDNLNCDACTAVAYEITNALKKAETSSKRGRLKESDYTSVFETVCSSKTYEHYGLKAVNGVNRLSGPGLNTASTPGMLQGGGKWPGRLSDKCFGFLEQVGEDELYAAFHELQDVQKLLCKEVSSDCRTKIKKDSGSEDDSKRVYKLDFGDKKEDEIPFGGVPREDL